MSTLDVPLQAPERPGHSDCQVSDQPEIKNNDLPLVAAAVHCFINASGVLDCGAMASCIVSFRDSDEITHAVQVEADSLYEAAALAICKFKKYDYEPMGLALLNVEIRTSITHSLTVHKLHAWLKQGARSPKDVLARERIRALLFNKPS